MSTTELVAEAFVAGWAVHGPADLPAGGRAAAEAALAVADEGDPWALDHVFEAAKRQGMLVSLERRRTELRRRHEKALDAVLAKLARAFPARRYAGELRRHLEPLGLVGGNDSDGRSSERRERAKHAAEVALVALLRRRGKLGRAWLSLVARARAEAVAEGWAQGHALAAIALGLEEVPDVDELYREVLAELTRDAAGYWAGADHWVDQELDGVAGDVGQRMASLLRDGANRAAMAAAANEAVGAGAGARFYLDEALHTEMQHAALRAYARTGIAYVDFQTENDGRVCPTCQDYEGESPWPVESAPGPPVHGRCRCWLVPAV